MAKEAQEIVHASVAKQARFLPVLCFLYETQEVKPIDKWSTYIKIKENDSYINIKNRFCICDYGGLKESHRTRNRQNKCNNGNQGQKNRAPGIP